METETVSLDELEKVALAASEAFKSVSAKQQKAVAELLLRKEVAQQAYDSIVAEAQKAADEIESESENLWDAKKQAESKFWIAKFDAYPQVVLQRVAGHTSDNERCLMHLFDRYIPTEEVAKKFAVSVTTVRLYSRGVWDEENKTLTYETPQKYVSRGRWGYYSGGAKKTIHFS